MLRQSCSVLRLLFNTSNVIKISQRCISGLYISKRENNLKENMNALLKMTCIGSNYLTTIRFKSKATNKTEIKKPGKQQDDEDDDDDYEDGSDEDDDTDEDIDENDDLANIDKSKLQPGYKIVKRHVPSLRCDALISAGLNISRKKVEDAFYGSKLRLNDSKILKKSRKADESDTLDILVSNKDGVEIKKRILLHKVFPEDANSKTNKPKVCMIVWKTGFTD